MTRSALQWSDISNLHGSSVFPRCCQCSSCQRTWCLRSPLPLRQAGVLLCAEGQLYHYDVLVIVRVFAVCSFVFLVDASCAHRVFFLRPFPALCSVVCIFVLTADLRCSWSSYPCGFRMTLFQTSLYCPGVLLPRRGAGNALSFTTASGCSRFSLPVIFRSNSDVLRLLRTSLRALVWVGGSFMSSLGTLLM